MMPNFTVEEKAFVQSVRDTVEGPLERILCIRTISYLMARANTPEMSMMMDRVQNKLGMMTDVEYSLCDFSVDESETGEEPDRVD
jgi:hypothetical protein